MIQTMRKSALIAALVTSVLVYAQASAASVYATIEGTIQGTLKGDAKRPGLENKTEVLKYDYSVTTPVSTATSRAIRREHGTVRITKLMGPASPQLFQALVTNETLKSVVIDFLGTSSTSGQDYLASQVRLTNARVVGIEQVTADTDSGVLEGAGKHTVSAGGGRILETIAFTFSVIEIISHDGKTSALDSIAAK